MGEVRKSDFARIRGVTAARVSQWISEGKLHGPALVGEGNRARINLEAANEQLGALDPNQVAAQQAATKSTLPPMTDDQRRIVAAKAEQAEIDLRKSKRQELEQAGVYCRTEDMRRIWARELGELVTGIDGWLTDLATAIARDTKSDQKQVMVTLRKEWRAFRQRRADLAQGIAETEPELTHEDG